ncbi:MAG: Hpt domain-containing protein [Pirellulaceae bacterium]
MSTDHSGIGGSNFRRDTTTAESTPLRILVVASDLVTRKVAAGLLASRGHDVQVASDVREMLEHAPTHTPQIVIMDMPLPDTEVDQAVASLRQSIEGGKREVRFVFISSSADSRESTAAAAFPVDDVITKPFQPDQLFEAVEGWKSSSPADATADAETPPFDWSTAVEQMDGREDLLKELVETFAIECESLTGRIRAAFDTNDQAGLQRAAHTLKGAACMFQAHSTVESARRLEFLAKDGKWDQAREAWADLQLKVKQLMPALCSHAAN